MFRCTLLNLNEAQRYCSQNYTAAWDFGTGWVDGLR